MHLHAAVLAFAQIQSPAPERRPRDEFPRSGVVELPPPPLALSATLRRPVFPVGPNVDATNDVRPQNETSIAVDPSNPLVLAAGTNDYRFGDAQAGIAISLDAGLTWTANTLNGLDTTLGKYDAQGDPALAAGPGVVYYAFIDFKRSDARNRLAVAKSTDGGASWGTLGVIIDHVNPTNEDFEDKEYIAVDTTGGAHEGNVYIAWTRFPSSGNPSTMFSRSIDAGVSYAAPQQLSDAQGCYQGTLPVVGPDGEVFVVWQHGSAIELDVSFDGGVTFGTDLLVHAVNDLPFPLPGASYRGNSFPAFAIDTTGGPHDGTLYVAWSDALGVGQGPDLLLVRSTDGGQSWSAPVRVSDDTNGSEQFFPWLSIAPNGVLNVFFFDRRDTPNSRFYNAYLARSPDGGSSFSKNVRVSTLSSDSSLDGFGGGFIGDYNGVTSSGSATHPYWTDVRATSANAEGFTARVP